MKATNFLSWLKAATLFGVMAVFGALVVTAADPPQPTPGRPGRNAGGPGGPGGGGNGPGPRGGGGGGGGMGMMGLDDQQRELYRQATQKSGDELRKLDEKLRAAQKELVQAVLAEKYDDQVVREKAEGVAKIQVEITTLRAKAFSVVAPTLKPEQRDQLENSRVGAAMLTGFGGGGGGGPGGGFGGPGGGNGPAGRRGAPGQ
jgi:Spy/CpxP family protein refolding chaperone